MARQKQYATAAEKQAAYRERKRNKPENNVTPAAPHADLIDRERRERCVVVTKIEWNDGWDVWLGDTLIGKYAEYKEADAALKRLFEANNG